jgi:ABC-type enterochelin transport system permease subunit
MMKKVIKITLVLIMVLGIAFSISNFISLELKAAEKTGAWVYKNGVRECMGFGNECDPFAYLPGG